MSPAYTRFVKLDDLIWTESWDSIEVLSHPLSGSGRSDGWSRRLSTGLRLRGS